MSTAQVRVTLRLRNDAMISARESLGLSQKDASFMCGVPLNKWGEYERFTFFGAPETIRRHVELIAGVLDISEDDVMPPGMEGVGLSHTHVRRFTMPSHELLGAGSNASQATRTMALPAPDRIDDDYVRSLGKSLDVVMGELSFREREILRARFGLGDGPSLTFEEVAKIFKVTRERVRQIEAKAIRKLQEPEKARRLEDFIR